jgi:hypothetical protein
MAAGDDRTDPVEALLDLLLYAPLGLITQLDELLPGLIERGRSQAVLARTIGEFAVRAGTTKAQGRAEDTQKMLEEAARSLFGIIAGLTDRVSPQDSPESSTGNSSRQSTDSTKVSSFPIADYDTLKATEIIPMLDDLEAHQRDEVEERERSGRSRKTILNRLNQLSASD